MTTLCDTMNRSMPGLPVQHQLPEFTQYLFDQHSRAPLPGHRLPSQVQRSWVETWGLGSMQDSQESMHWCRARTGRGRLWELREGTLSPVGVLQR